MCLAGTVVASRSLTQEVAGSSLFTVMTNIFVTEFSKFNETFKKNSIVHLPLAHHPYYPLQFPHFVYLSYYINAHQLTPTLPISHIVFKMHHLKCSAISFMPISANELEDGISFSKATKSAKNSTGTSEAHRQRLVLGWQESYSVGALPFGYIYCCICCDLLSIILLFPDFCL